MPSLPLPFRGRRPAGTRRAAHAVRVQPVAPRRFTVGPAEPRRPRRSIPWRRIGLGLGGIALTGGLVYGLAFLLLGDTLRVREIYVHGTEVADPQEVANAAGLSGRSLVTLDAAGAVARLDTLPEIKAMLRVCAFHLYGWACEHPSVAEQAAKVTSGWIPDGYPKSWPSPDRTGVLPPGAAPFSERIAREIAKRKRKIKADIENAAFLHYPKEEVLDVLKFWGIELS